MNKELNQIAKELSKINDKLYKLITMMQRTNKELKTPTSLSELFEEVDASGITEIEIGSDEIGSNGEQTQSTK